MRSLFIFTQKFGIIVTRPEFITIVELIMQGP
jgi:hypothetical protein